MAAGAAERRAEPAAGHAADRLPRRVEQGGALARDHPAFGFQAYAPAGRGRVEDARGAGKAAFRPPAFRYRPAEAGFERRRVLADIVAVEAKARLQPQRIARAEPRPADRFMRKQPRGQRLRIPCGHRELEPVPAGIARTRHPRRHAAGLALAPGHEGQAGELRQHRRRRRPLQGEQRPVRLRQDVHPAPQMAAEMRRVMVLARRIDDQAQAARQARDDQVVQDAAVCSGEQRVAHGAAAEAAYVAGRQRLQGRIGAGAHQGAAGPYG